MTPIHDDYSSPSRHIDRLINVNHHSSQSRAIYSDRFIPSRTGSNFALFNLSAKKDSIHHYGDKQNSEAYAKLLQDELFGPDRNIFRYKTETRQPIDSILPLGFNHDSVSTVNDNPRKIPKSSNKVLDAPLLGDDYYSSLVDWSSHSVLAVGLTNCVYLRNAGGEVIELCNLESKVCSVNWEPYGTCLAVGTLNGKIRIYDASSGKKIRIMEGHQKRVGSIAWNAALFLSSGSLDTNILHRDLRSRDDFIAKLTQHKGEICGLKWSHDNRELASGGADKKLFVWNQHLPHPLRRYTEHEAAVKAIAWSPHLNRLLASGGGSADKCIRFWNTNTDSQLSFTETGSQVCNLVWSKNVNEIVSTHGYYQNQIIVWKYPTMSKLATLTGHYSRVLHLAMSPDGKTIVTGAGDDTLRFWNVFPSPKSKNSEGEFGSFSLGRTAIR